MSNNVKDIKGTGAFCVCCDAPATIKYQIIDRGYGSKFDCMKEPTIIPVCEKCSHSLKPEWFTEEAKTVDGYKRQYVHEEKIMHFIDGLREHVKEQVLYGGY